MGVSGGSHSTWPLYEQVHEILDGFDRNWFTEVKPDNNVGMCFGSFITTTINQNEVD